MEFRPGHENMAKVRFSQRKDAIVFEQYNGFLRHPPCELLVGVAIDDPDRQLRPWHAGRWIKHPKLELRRQQAAEGHVDVRLAEQAKQNGIMQLAVGATAVQITAIFHRQRGGFRGVLCEIVVPVKIVKRSAIRNDVTLKPQSSRKIFWINVGLAQQASPLVRLYAPMTDATLPSQPPP